MDSPGVCLSWIFPRDVSGWFAMSVANMLTLDARYNQHIIGPRGDIIAISSSPRIAEARNQVIDNFAALEQQPEWLLMIDSDMTFEPDLLERMLAVADPVEVPILGGLCFAGGRHHDPYPTIYRQIEKDGYLSVDRVYDYPRDALVKVGATGAACMLIHRNALGAMKNNYNTKPDGSRNPYPWFAEGVVGPEGEPWGEDIIFCLKAGALGIPVHVHTGIKLGHIKDYVVDEAYYDARRAARREDELWKSGETPAVNGDRAARRRKAREKVR